MPACMWVWNSCWGLGIVVEMDPFRHTGLFPRRGARGARHAQTLATPPVFWYDNPQYINFLKYFCVFSLIRCAWMSYRFCLSWEKNSLQRRSLRLNASGQTCFSLKKSFTPERIICTLSHTTTLFLLTQKRPKLGHRSTRQNKNKTNLTGWRALDLHLLQWLLVWFLNATKIFELQWCGGVCMHAWDDCVVNTINFFLFVSVQNDSTSKNWIEDRGDEKTKE